MAWNIALLPSTSIEQNTYFGMAMDVWSRNIFENLTYGEQCEKLKVESYDLICGNCQER